MIPRAKKVKNYCEPLAGKKVTLMGLGLLGRGVNDAKFLADCGADLTVTDLKTRDQLASSVKQLAKYPTIKLVLGEHRLADFSQADLIIKAAGVPLDSPFIAEAKKHGVSVEMSTALFARLAMARGVKIIGITGTRGKSTVTQMVYEILQVWLKHKSAKVYLGGNVRGVATLPLIKKVKAGDYVVLELDSWQLQGFGASRVSPQLAVFTTFLPDHQNYYHDNMDLYLADKLNILKYQQPGDILVVGRQAWPSLKIDQAKTLAIIADDKNVPSGWKLKLLGAHNRANAGVAVAAAQALGVADQLIKKVVENFAGIPGRLELIRHWQGIKFYNDTNATTPDATLAALQALGKNKKVILIMGGASKQLDMSKLISALPDYCRRVILLPGTGTAKLDLRKIKNGVLVKELKEALSLAVGEAKRGDIILFSPAFASFGPPPGGFKNEYDRGDKFNRLVKELK